MGRHLVAVIGRRSFLGLLCVLAASASGIIRTHPDAVLEVTVEENRTADFEEKLAELLVSMGFALVRNQVPMSGYWGWFLETKNATVAVSKERNGSRFSVVIDAGGQPVWKPIGAEILRMVKTLPYCKITALDWFPQQLE